MTPALLLRDVDGLCHADRVRRLVEVGRQSRKDETVKAALALLEEGGFYERFLSLLACHGSRDGERVLRGLRDPSRLLRGLSMRLLTLMGSDEQIVQGLSLVMRSLRKPFLARLRRSRRLAAIDAWLEKLAASMDRDLEILLPFGSAKVVEKHLPRVVERGGSLLWVRLARHHPRIAVALFGQHIPTGERVGARFTWRCNIIFPILSHRVPDECLTLARALVRVVTPSSLSWRRLMQQRPRQTADLLLALRNRSAGMGSFNVLAHRLDRDRILALAKRRLIDIHTTTPAYPWRTSKPYRWLEVLQQALRGEIAAACRDSRRAKGTLPVGLLRLLPSGLHQGEARRHLARPSQATQHLARMPYLGLLPWDEALAGAAPFLHHPDADLRSAALTALAIAVPLQRQHASDYLALVRARKNEQDPVRLAMMTSLTGIPSAVWQPEHLDELAGVLREALDAADLSGGTFSQANLLVLRQVRRHPQWAANWLTTLVRERGNIGWYQLDSLLGDGDIGRLLPVLLPVLRAWRKTERDAPTLNLAAALGRRLRICNELLDQVESIVRTTRQPNFAAMGLNLLLQHARPRLADLIPRLLREDPSWITQPAISQYLHRRRQDLLTPFLGRQPIRGRFDTGKTRFVLPLSEGFVRWSASQQETFAVTLREIINDADPMRDTPSICTALRQIAALPAVPPDAVIAHASDKRPAIRDTTLRLLGRLDAGQGVPVLLEAMDDDRARIAIYALRRALLGMPEAHALDLLRKVRLNKVTVAKEVVRLVGERDSDAAFAFLEEVEASSPHRDVRVALLRAVWAHLERPAAWNMIDRAVAVNDPALMNTVVRIPSDRLSNQGRRRLAQLLDDLLRHPEPTVRLEVLQRCVVEPPEDPQGALLLPVLHAVCSRFPDERLEATRAAMRLCISTDADRVAQAVKAMTSNRRAMLALVGSLQDGLREQRRRLAPVARAVVAALADDPFAATVRLPLALVSLTGRQLQSFLLEADAAGWRPDVLMVTAATLQSGAAHMERSELQQLEEELAASPSAALRRLALSALIAQTAKNGWDEERLQRLQAFRADPDALVAAHAQLTLPAEEEE